MNYRQEHEGKIVCPHCLYENEGDGELNEAYEGAKWHCTSCNKSFIIETVVRTITVTTLKESDSILNEISLVDMKINRTEKSGLCVSGFRKKREELSMKLAELLLKERQIEENSY
ncbi:MULTISPECIES: hypothetical protein [unclassified Saccharibacter]|nr:MULTISPECIES: hypothetical protein [unclassified Saccharibacter]MXV58337.1 hypothetical protein [Saccharibacter sp. EH70]MXV58408.1 hypothetical protein [Saccharibacter sp. EH70]MXV65854.1 hypothetical protein [Saccharibacter sp. EH60]